MNRLPIRPASLFWVDALNQPERALGWTLPQWEQAVRLARRLRMLARLGASMQAAGCLDRLPAPAQRHLKAEMRYADWRCNALRWTLRRVSAMLGDTPYPRVLLKGAAYMGQELTIGTGRLPSDADILVPRRHIGDAQQRLVAHGWAEQPLDDHDRRYYHEWSHEVPPMRHPLLAVELDLHHNIVPPTASTRVDAELLLAQLVPSRWPGWHVLQPTDQVLHSALHLFHDSENRDRVRDLADLDGLLRHFGPLPGFWEALSARSRSLGLSEILALAVHFCAGWFRTPIPDPTREAIERLGPGPLRRAWLYPLLESVLTPADADRDAPLTQTISAQWLLLRHHLWRMPLTLLVPHLLHKMRGPSDIGKAGDLAAERRLMPLVPPAGPDQTP